jgi:glycine/D-amino acid oxidase-like deaminating enzyme
MDSVVVVGAGTFGASLAWWLAREGVEVTLVDQFEPGDRRATSGGETRLIRCGHGEDPGYTASARRARTLWRELEAESGADLLIECGLVWFAGRADGWEAASERTMRAQGIPVERLPVEEGARLFPSFRGDDLEFLLHEPEAGVLRAQRAVQTLARQAGAHGARVVRGRAEPEGARVVIAERGASAPEDGPSAPGVRASAGGERLEADIVVWACGGWLADLFPGLCSLTTTRQDLFFMDGGEAWTRAPGWVEYDAAVYGTGDLDDYGVKGAPDFEGPPLAPDAELPPTDPANERWIRDYFARRFPALAEAPLKGSTSCRYELSPDSHFIAAPHPEHPTVWLLGGGSGHGFKHGPAMAEAVASALRGGAPLPERYRLGERAVGRSMRTAGSGR